MNQSEKQIERACCRLAEAHGWIALKAISPNRQGIPDRIFLGDKGATLWVEFKKPGGRTSPIQDRTIKEFSRKGHAVFVLDCVEEFRKLIGLNGD